MRLLYFSLVTYFLIFLGSKPDFDDTGGPPLPHHKNEFRDDYVVLYNFEIESWTEHSRLPFDIYSCIATVSWTKNGKRYPLLPLLTTRVHSISKNCSVSCI